MKERVEIQNWYSIEDCNANPNKYYIFGDNLIKEGTGGQAIIRYCKNAIGIPTKRLPSMNEEAFFSDKQEEKDKVIKRLDILFVMYNLPDNYTIVFPADGLGTGRAQLKERSPEIYKLIDDKLIEYFDVHIQP